MHRQAHHVPIQMVTATYSFHETTTAMPVARVAQQWHHRHRQPSACMMTIGPLNGRPVPTSVCHDEGKYLKKNLYIFSTTKKKNCTNLIGNIFVCEIDLKNEKKYSCFFFVKNRFRLTSSSDDDDYDDDVHPLYDDFEEFMAARERLQEFPGRIPPGKKRASNNSQPRKSRVSISF